MSTTENTITVITPRTFDEAKAMSTTLSKASILPAALRGKEADVLMTVMAGAELGLGPVQSIRSIHIIDGKPSLSADLIAALCLRNRDVCEYLQPVESSAKVATYEAKRRGAPAPFRLSFTIDEAKAAGLTGKGNWAKYPAAMLRARCISAICRAVFPDLVGGLYDSDSGEIEATAKPQEREVNAAPVVVEAPPASPPVVAEVVRAAPPSPPRKHAFVDAPPAEADPITLEVLALLAAIDRATDEAALNALVPRITALPARDKATVRVAWGAKRDALRGGK